MDVKPSTALALVGIVFVMMGGAITLRIFGEDISIIITLVTILAVPVLAAFGVKVHEGIQEIKTNTNGRDDKKMEIIQDGQRAMQENSLAFQKAMQDNVIALQAMVTDLALKITPSPAPVKESEDDHPPTLHLPG